MVDVGSSNATAGGPASGRRQGAPGGEARDGAGLGEPGDGGGSVHPGGPVKYVCFRLAGQEYAVEIANVKETMMVLPITRVFLTPPWLAGIINLRGDIVAVIDLAQFMDLPATLVSDHSRIVICRHRGRVVGVVVDEMTELRALESSQVQPAPPTLTGASAALLAGVAAVDGEQALRVLDLARLFDSERLRAFQRKRNR